MVGNTTDKFSFESNSMIFYAVKYAAHALGVDSTRILSGFETMNRIVISFILSMVLSFLSFGFLNTWLPRYLTVPIVYGFSYMLIIIVEFFAKKFHKTDFYIKDQMNLADYIDKTSGPNQRWDLVTEQEYALRKKIGQKISTLFIMQGTIVVIAIAYTAYLVQGGEYINMFADTGLGASLTASLTYVVLLYFLTQFCIHLDLKDSIMNRLGKYVYGFLLMICVTILLYIFLTFLF